MPLGYFNAPLNRITTNKITPIKVFLQNFARDYEFQLFTVKDTLEKSSFECKYFLPIKKVFAMVKTSSNINVFHFHNFHQIYFGDYVADANHLLYFIRIP